MRLPDVPRIRVVREVLQGLRAEQLRFPALHGERGAERPERFQVDLDLERLRSAGHVQDQLPVLPLRLLDGLAEVHERALVSVGASAEGVGGEGLAERPGHRVVEPQPPFRGRALEDVLHDEGPVGQDGPRAGGSQIHEESGDLLVRQVVLGGLRPSSLVRAVPDGLDGGLRGQDRPEDSRDRQNPDAAHGSAPSFCSSHTVNTAPADRRLAKS